MPSAFANILTGALLKELADERSYQRGEAYLRQGRVESLAELEEVISAQVQGSETYEVEFWLEEDGELGYQCDCPVGEEGWFCKHCVAVGLTWLNNPPAATKKRSKHQAATSMTDVQRYLEQQEKPALVRLILDRAMQDASWREQLLLKVAALSPKGVDVKTFQQALKNATKSRGYIDYGETRSFARGIEKVLHSIADLLKEGQTETGNAPTGNAPTVIELCEYAIPLVEASLRSADDSNGDIGAVLADIQELHYEACVLAKPDPVALAGRLFEFEMDSEFEVFLGAVDTYAEVLGKTGLAHYQALAEAAWKKLPPLTAGQRSSYSSNRWRLTHMMEQLARQSGDVEAVVAVKERDLSSAYHYLQIAQLYQDAKQPDRALQWAEDGLKAFPDRTDSRLRDFVVQTYQQQGRFAEAMAIVWLSFTESPSLTNYQHLKAEAERSSQWQKWRKEALNYMRQKIKQADRKSPYYNYWQRDHSLLVEIFLWEGETDLAWQEAKAGNCSKQLWLKLAEQRQIEHPEDALSIYMNEVEPLIQQTNNSAYASAVNFLKKIRPLMEKLELRSQYQQYVEHLRTAYKSKRNFIGLLNQEKL